MRGFTVSSRLGADPAHVWEVVTSVEGVNYELWPVVRMTVPRQGAELRTGDLGRSWILLGGLIPIDYDDLHLASIDPGRGFSERSVLGSASSWHHDRELLPDADGGCRVVDRIAFEPRLRALGGLQELVLEAMFRWRHRRLRRRFGASNPGFGPNTDP